MTPTNEVRAKLDELGIAWVAISESATEYTQEGILYRAYETRGGLQVAILTPVTPEQAIAATVGAGTCKNIGHDTFVCSECGAHVHITNVGRSYLDENGKRWYSTSNEHKFRHCPNCGKQIVEEEAE